MTVTAAKKKRYAPAAKVSRRQSSTFPDMFVANIDGTCHTPDSVDLVFPDPGAAVETAGKGPFTTATCNAGKGGMNAASTPTAGPAAGSSAPATGGSAGGAPAPTSAPAGAPTSAPGFAGGNNGQYSQAAGGAGGPVPTSAPTASSSADGNQVIPVTPSAGQTFTPVSSSATASGPPYANSSVPQVASGNTAAASQTVAAAAAGSTGTTGGSSNPPTGGSSAGQLSGPCTSEGDWNCIDGTSFQRCASGAWSAVIPLGNMKCTPGESSSFAMTPAKRFVA